MKLEIGLKEIPIFKYLDQTETEILGEAFEICEAKKGEKILTFGLPVQGLYILLEGEVGVFTEASDTQLAKIVRGGCVGEMSLLEDGQRSSAHIIVTTETARLLFCEQHRFDELLKSSASVALSFYRGAAELVSKRLRNTNEAISKQLDMAQKIMGEMSQNSHLSQFLGKTRSSIDNTGSNMVGQLLGIVLEIDKVAKRVESEQAHLGEIGQKLEALVLTESQNFDVISQQMDLIMQFFNNMRRVLKGEAPQEIKGDLKLLTR